MSGELSLEAGSSVVGRPDGREASDGSSPTTPARAPRTSPNR